MQYVGESSMETLVYMFPFLLQTVYANCKLSEIKRIVSVMLLRVIVLYILVRNMEFRRSQIHRLSSTDGQPCFFRRYDMLHQEHYYRFTRKCIKVNVFQNFTHIHARAHIQFARDFRVTASARAIYLSIRGYFVNIYSNICNNSRYGRKTCTHAAAHVYMY